MLICVASSFVIRYIFYCLGGSFLYFAPNEGRDGMDQFVSRLTSRENSEEFSIQLIEQKSCPDE